MWRETQIQRFKTLILHKKSVGNALASYFSDEIEAIGDVIQSESLASPCQKSNFDTIKQYLSLTKLIKQ